jgi:hypothetical protein
LAAAAVAAAAATVLSSVHAQSVPARADEYRVKAAILYNLVKFVNWPDDAFASPGAPLLVCVIGADPFGRALEAALRERQVGGRPIVPRRIGEVIPGCHVLFVSTSEHRRLPVIADRVAGMSVLTVSEDDAFLDQGGMIHLSTEGERVVFSINQAAAERARLKVSARLLAMASVRVAGGKP